MAAYLAPRCIECNKPLTIVHLLQFAPNHSLFITAICFPCVKYHIGWAGEDNHLFVRDYKQWKKYSEEKETEITLRSPAIFTESVPYKDD